MFKIFTMCCCLKVLILFILWGGRETERERGREGVREREREREFETNI
jgi:hypothetical protein